MNSAKLCLLCLYRERLLAERMKLKFWSMVFVDGAFSGGLFRSAFISLRGKQMKKTMVLALLACAAISTTSERAEDFAGVKTAKAVWDITTGEKKILPEKKQQKQSGTSRLVMNKKKKTKTALSKKQRMA